MLLLSMFIARDNTCTKVICKILSSHNKAIRHTCNSLVWPTITFLAAHVRDKDCINYQHTPFCGEVLNVAFNIPLKVCSNSVILLMHYSKLTMVILNTDLHCCYRMYA